MPPIILIKTKIFDGFKKFKIILILVKILVKFAIMPVCLTDIHLVITLHLKNTISVLDIINSIENYDSITTYWEFTLMPRNEKGEKRGKQEY